MTGEVGTGKTTLLYSLLSTLDSGVETAYVNNPALPVDQILQAILEDFELDGHGSTRLELLNALNDFLLHCAGRNVTVALVFDEAQVLSDEAFEEIRLLLNFENYDQKLLQIILVGQQELAIRLQSWKLRQLADRVAIRCRLEPLSNVDSRKYIEHRIGGGRRFCRSVHEPGSEGHHQEESRNSAPHQRGLSQRHAVCLRGRYDEKSITRWQVKRFESLFDLRDR